LAYIINFFEECAYVGQDVQTSFCYETSSRKAAKMQANNMVNANEL